MKKQLERKRESIHEITVKKREWYINVSKHFYTVLTTRKVDLWPFFMSEKKYANQLFEAQFH